MDSLLCDLSLEVSLDLQSEHSMHQKALARLARDSTTLTEQVMSNIMLLTSIRFSIIMSLTI